MDLNDYKAKPNKSIRQHTDDLINNLKDLSELSYVKEDMFNIVKLACEYHDYGKANREFQNRIINGTKFNTDKEVAHNVLSLYFIDKNQFEKEEDYYRVCFAVIYHHYYCDVFKTITEKETKNLIKDLLLDFNGETYKVTPRNIKKLKEIMNDDKAILIKGLVNKCDFSASGGSIVEYENNFLEKSLEELLISWKSANEKAKWNELQEFCIDNRNENIIAIAQTGMGKTEAGLLWIGDTKGFFILPLKTAINAIYNRIAIGIVTKGIETKVALLHSDTLSYYTKHTDKERDILEYHKVSRQLSIPLNIATLDQIFDFVLKCQGYEMKLATLSYSKIVIDEIQMYGADLLAYLIYGIKRIIKLGGKVAILTATLAPFVKDMLEKEGCNFKDATFINDIERHNIKCYDSKISSRVIFDKYEENENKNISNKILVVCNTVKKAQEIYKELENLGLDSKKLKILHSKFIKKDRSEKEDEILEFGKTENKGSQIWISTQIVEASLDIDFDYLFTELSDINGLFQRLGRCNRKGRKLAKKNNCFIFLNVDEGILTNGDKGFIDRDMYELSRAAIKDINGILSEKRKVNIINETLTTERIRGSKYYTEYEEFMELIKAIKPYEFDKKDIKFRNIISYTIMPYCIYKKHLIEIEAIRLELDAIKERMKNIYNENLGEKERGEVINKLKVKKVRGLDEIKKFTVSVSQGDMNSFGADLLVEEIELSKFESIPVIDCIYSELGVVKDKKRERDIEMRYL